MILKYETSWKYENNVEEIVFIIIIIERKVIGK